MIDDAKLGRTSLDALLLPLFTFLFCYAAMLKQETDRPGMFFFEQTCVFGGGVQFRQCVGKLFIGYIVCMIYPSVRAITLFFFLLIQALYCCLIH